MVWHVYVIWGNMLRIGQSLIKPGFNEGLSPIGGDLVSSVVFSDSDNDQTGMTGPAGGDWDAIGYVYSYNIAFWFRPTADASSTTGTHSAVIFEIVGSTKGIKLSYVDGAGDSEKLVMSHGNGTAYVDTTIDYDLDHDKWYHICIGYDYAQKDLECYINGNLEYTDTNFAKTVNGGGTSLVLCDGDFTGNITQFILWNGTGSPDDGNALKWYSRNLYNNGYGINPSEILRDEIGGDLQAWWPLNKQYCSTGSGGIKDLSSFSNHLTATNMVEADFQSTELPNGLQSVVSNVNQFQLNFDGNDPSTYEGTPTRTNYDDQHAYLKMGATSFFRPGSAESFTIAIWFKSDYSGSAFQSLIDFSSSDIDINFRMGLLGLKPYFSLQENESTEWFGLVNSSFDNWADDGGTAPSGSFSSDTWSLFTISAELSGSGSDEIFTIYRNATADGTLTHNVPFGGSPAAESDRLYIGRIGSNYADQEAGGTERLRGEAGNFKGAISQIGVWKGKALSSSEVTEIYKSGAQANWIGPDQSCRDDLNYYWVFGDGPEQFARTGSPYTRIQATSWESPYTIQCVPGTKGGRNVIHTDDKIYLNTANHPTWSEQ